tara:strand:+ start:65 stop:280 length:216 start_codon:yes stop_codon:yes gene_type:complete
MSLEFFILGGYGHFVWPAFIFTFACCLLLYSNTVKEFQKQEKIFLKELKKVQPVEIRAIKEKKNLSSNPIF